MRGDAVRVPDPAELQAMSRQLTYDPASGTIVRVAHRRSNLIGRPVTMIDLNGYGRVWNKGRHYKAHRVAWYLHYGEWPEAIIDHINGNKADNRISNLRLATKSQNAGNMVPRGGSSRFKGVTWAHGHWEVRLIYNGRPRYLGGFHDEEEAARAYDRAAASLFGAFARLNFPVQP